MEFIIRPTVDDEPPAPAAPAPIAVVATPRRDVLIAVFFAVAGLVICARDVTVGGVRWKDESTHVMDGALLHDWLAAGPSAWGKPLDFASRQYAHFPNLGFMGAFPPGMALLEAPCFAILGVSVVSARLLVAVCGAAAAAGCYLLARRWCSTWSAALAAAILLAMPIVIVWGRQAMLEMPTLATVIWLFYAACRYFEKPTWRGLLIVAGLAFFAPLCKQSGGFAIPVLGAMAVWHWWRKRLPLRHLLGGAVIVGGPVATYVVLTGLVQGQGQILARVFNGDTPLREWFSAAELSFYGRGIARQATGIVAVLAAGGVLLSVTKRTWHWAMVALAFVAVYALVTVMQHKESRYLYLAYLPIALWAGLSAGSVIDWLRAAKLRNAVGVAGVGLALAWGYRTPINYRPDFNPLAGAYAAEMRGDLVLVEADRDTAFVLAARETLGPLGGMVVRGSKLLYSSSCNLDWDFASHVSTREEVRELLERFAFRLIFVERGNPNKLREVELLEAELADAARYEHVGAHALTVPGPHHAKTLVIDVFRPRNAGPRLAREIEIPVPLARRTVRVALDGATYDQSRTRR